MAKKSELKPIKYVADDPDNIHLSKSQFVEKRRTQKEKEAKIEEYTKQLDNEKTSTVAHDSTEPVKRGRPKKVE